jgi:polyphosphate kinase 2
MLEYDIAEYSQINPDLYRRELRKLQAEFLKLQKWVIKEKKKIAIVFEGRDTAGKTGSISVLSKYLIPEHVRLVKLGIPTKRESQHWFSRYEKHMPNVGEIVFFDRSWYTRALTEITMNYCSERQYKYFMKNVLSWEKEFSKENIEIVKIYLSVKKDIQKKRFEKRKNSPLIFWKFSENDLKVADRWDAFTFYKNQMFATTSSEKSPWVVINANTKMVASLNSLRYILEKFEYPEKNIPKPKKWSKGMNIYNLKINGVKFENLSYDQFKVLSSFSDE